MTIFIGFFCFIGSMALFMIATFKYLEAKSDNSLEEFQDSLAKAVADSLFKTIVENPNMPLTETGFYWACYFALKKYWDDITVEEAGSWLIEYTMEPFGSPEYDWTFAEAEVLACEYVKEFGEKS